MKVGQLVELNDGRKAVVRYAGQLHFTTGDWIGVEFDDATGKNDGSAKGVRYFQCDADHGMFLKPTMILRVIQPPKQVAKAPVKASGSQKARLSIIGTSSGRLPVSKQE